MNSTQAWTEYCRSLAPAIVETCTRTPVSAGPAALARALGSALPDWKFRHAFSRGGWYRLGGIVDGQENRISDNLEKWVEEALADNDGDLGALIDAYADADLYATRLVGQTHYLVATVGNGHDDFLQLEIEDLQEMRAHRLFSGDPSTIEELIDPRDDSQPLKPIGLPFYAFRRVQHIGAFLARMRAQKPEPAPIHRMLDDWTHSSAGHSCVWSNQWVIATREHLDRYHQPVFHAQPIATLAGDPPSFEASAGCNGLKLHQALSQFDRAAGYPMAWYFHMLSSKAVPHWVAQTVVEDMLGGFAYLPHKDFEVVRRWLHQPYGLRATSH